MKPTNKPAISSKVIALLITLIIPVTVALISISLATGENIIAIATLAIYAIFICIAILIKTCEIVYQSLVDVLEQKRIRRRNEDELYMQDSKCDKDYNKDSLHIHKNKCKTCEYFNECEYIKAVKEVKDKLEKCNVGE